MTTLYLHIGSHKTGTTSIQKALTRRTDSSSAAFLNIRKGERKLISASGHRQNFEARLDVDLARERFATCLAGSPVGISRYIASDEGLFWLADPAQVSDLASILKEMFDEVRIICYLRRQEQVALAHRRQVVSGSPARRFYGVDISALPRHHPYMDEYFDYDFKLSRVWAPAFGHECISVVPFSRETLVDGDVVADFSSRVGVRFASGKPINSNSSLAGNQTFLGLYLIDKGVRKADVMVIISKLVGEGRFLPSRSAARRFQICYEEANERLSRNWSRGGVLLQFGDDFDMYPPEGEDGPWNYLSVRDDLAKVLDKEALRELGL